MIRDFLTAVLLIAAGLMVLIGLSQCVQRASADLPTHVMLAKMAVSESGFDSPDDMRGIWACMKNTSKAKNVPIRRLMRGYSSRVFDKGRTDRRQWVAHLEAAERPVGWPEANVPWKRVGLKRWQDVLKLARVVVKEPPACNATDWGMASDWAKWKREWVKVDCGDKTRNIFGRAVR